MTPAIAERVARRTVGLALAMASTTMWSPATHAQPSRARLGPLEAWTARSASGACQLRLRNVGDVPIEAWTLTVRSDAARHVTLVRADHWRDPFHLPLQEARIDPGATQPVTIREDAAIGPLTVRVSLLVRSDGIAYGNPEEVSGVGDADHERAALVERRRRVADEALVLARRIESAVEADGVARVLATRFASTLLEHEGEWNWWRVHRAALAAEARAVSDAAGAAALLRDAIAVLKDAHAKGTAPVTLHRADPLRPVAVGSCDD